MNQKNWIKWGIALIVTLSVLFILEGVKQEINDLKVQMESMSIQINQLQEESINYLARDDLDPVLDKLVTYSEEVHQCMDEVRYLKDDFSAWQGMWDALFNYKQQEYLRTRGE